jgi:hypothetical protein
LIGTEKNAMLSNTAVDLGRWAVRAFMIGMVVVGLVAGFALGRIAERTRRGYKDYGTARTTLATGRKAFFGSLGRATVTVIVVGAFLIALFIGAYNLPK